MGLPKSGTTHLQGLLAQNRPALRGAGFLYPFVRPEGMFHAAVELRGQYDLWGLSPDLVDGTWEQLLQRVRTHPDTTGVISHEILAGAAPSVIERIVADTADLELHVVLTVRDLARQAVAHWQEEVKNGRPWSFAEFTGALWGPEESTAAETGFWRSQDLDDVLARWGAHVPAERIHVVTVPPRGTAPEVLTRRFAQALGLPPGLLPAEGQDRANRSLGRAQVRALREVVAALDGRIPQPAYAHVVKRWLAQGVLAATPGTTPRAPADLVAELEPVARRWTARIEQAGHRVVGDLADLVPVPDPEAPHPDDVAPEEVAALMPGLLAEALAEIARLRFAPPPPDDQVAPPAPDRRAARRWRRTRRGPH